MIRSPKYLKAARGEHCMVQIPGVCNYDPTTTVMAHSNKSRHGKGLGIKAHDCFVALACSNCHSVVDGHHRTTYTKADIDMFWQNGFEKTLLWAFENGHMKFS